MITNITKNFKYMVNKLNIEFAQNGYGYLDSTWGKRDVTSPYSRLYYMQKGTAYLEYDGKTIEMKAGNVYFIPANLVFSFYAHGPFEKVYFYINLYGDNGYDIFFNFNEILQEKVSDEDMENLKNNYFKDDFFAISDIKREVLSRVVSMVGEETISALLTTSYSTVIKNAVNYITDNLSMQISADEVAKHLKISPSSLNRKFKEELGITTSKYIDDLIFVEAERFLLKTNCTIQLIAEELGFCDQFYFARRFRQRYNMTPSEYRRKQATSKIPKRNRKPKIK